MEHFKEILFIDIETAPAFPDYSLLTERMQYEWKRKLATIRGLPEGTTPGTAFYERAGVFSEFAKVVCIGFGSLYQNGAGWEMRLKSLVHEDEKQLLLSFCDMLARFSKKYADYKFCGHNIKEFDIPFLCRRMVINNVPLPASMQVAGKKPWEVTHFDTMELWRFGDYKNFTALSLLAEVLGIPSPKSDIDGSMVADVFWKEGNLARIGSYCLQDVYTTAKVFLRLRGGIDFDPVAVYA